MEKLHKCTNTHSMTRNSSARQARCIISPWRAVPTAASLNMFRALVLPLQAGLAPCYTSGRQPAIVQAAPPCSTRPRRTGLAWLTTANHCSLEGTTCLKTSTRCLRWWRGTATFQKWAIFPFPRRLPISRCQAYRLSPHRPPFSRRLASWSISLLCPVSPSSALTPQGKLPLLAMTASDLLKTGGWPALCAGRRDWLQGQPIQVALPATSVRSPPTNWDQLSQEKKLTAWQAISVLLSWLDEPEERFPDASPSRLMDDYSFMALPGSGVDPRPQDKADQALGELWVRNHQALKTASAKDPQLDAELVALLYNMVGVAVAIVISTMHEKSCIDLHNSWKFEKSSKIQSFIHLAITMMKLRENHCHEFCKLS